jgi:simple sugar transport system ATP-binding protein
MILEARSISKRFGAVAALDDVTARFLPGRIHAVLGENGAGKSTLVSVLAGFLTPDTGEVLLDGRPIPLGHAHQCRRLGIEMIHQHFTLVPQFTVEENLALSALTRLTQKVDGPRLAKAALAAGERLGWHFDPSARVCDLPVGVQQRLEILKALASDAPVLILDEPTAVLTPDEVEELFRVLRQLRSEGKVIILIAHKLREVLNVADEVTVLRRGWWVGHAPVSELSEAQLATWIVGELPEPRQVRPAAKRELLRSFRDLSVKGDRGETAVRGVSFELYRGEILGFGGVDGNGQVELAEHLAGVRGPDPEAGSVA